MKTTELRIGNYVGLKGHTLDDNQIVHHEVFNVQVASLCEDGTVELKCVMNGKELRAVHKETELVPIPLTEELLLKCGLTKTPGNKKFYDWFKTEKFAIRLWFNPQNKAGFVTYRYVKIEYLHQLQNIAFALTGEELQIDPTAVAP